MAKRRKDHKAARLASRLAPRPTTTGTMGGKPMGDLVGHHDAAPDRAASVKRARQQAGIRAANTIERLGGRPYRLAGVIDTSMPTGVSYRFFGS